MMRMWRLVRPVALAMAVGLAAIVPNVPAAQAAPGESQVPAENPDLDRACGLNVMVILDESGSIDTSNATEDVRNAYRAFISSLNNTGSSVATIEFSSVARLPVIGGAGGDYVTIDDTTIGDFNDYIDDDYNPSGYTNWEDAMRVGRFFAPRPSAAIPHLVVFITDGDPTAYIDNSRVTATEYRTKVPLDSNEVRTNQSENSSLRPAIPNANALKDGGSHILAIGVGEALQNDDSVDRLVDMSGPDIFDGTGTFDISTDDVYLEPDFSLLEDALREAAFQLCAPSVSIRKLVDFTPDPDSTADAVSGTGFTLQGTVTDLAADDFDWVLPPGADQDSTSAFAITDGSGFATFQWTPDDPTHESDFSVQEVIDNPNFTPQTGQCTFRTPDSADAPFEYEPILGPGGVTIGFSMTDIPAESIVTCQFVNLVTPDPSMTLEKYTNGVDADDPTGPYIEVGDDVEWTYVVTNTGNLILSNIVVTDLPAQDIDCPETTLAQGEFMTCTATGVAQLGQYANTANVNADDSYGNALTPVTDPSHYFGAGPGITITKSVVSDGVEYDADTLIDDDGNVIAPLVEAGVDSVSWTFDVTNDGNQDLENVVVTDPDVGPITGPTGDDGDGLLNPGETWSYTAPAQVAVLGPFENLAEVNADVVAPGTGSVSDNDPAHYLGYNLDVEIVKYTNGADADDPDGLDVPRIGEGDDVTWTYEVTNIGNVPLTEVTVTDDQGVTVTCPDTPDPLLPDVRVFCTATGIAEDTGSDDPYANVGTVVGDPFIPPGVILPVDHPLLTEQATDTNPSHYIGLSSSIDIEKATNGEDADLPTGPFVPVGDAVAWSYEVVNTGSSILTNVMAFDYRVVGGVTQIACSPSTLAPGAAATCDPILGIGVVGQFFNLSGVVGTDEFGNRVFDFDPSHYFGADSAINLEKYTNGLDADLPPGAFIEVGEPVEWTYVVTNLGNTELTGIVVTDDPAQTIDCSGVTTLAPDASMTCTATGVAEAGLYANTATVVGTPPVGADLTDTDPSHYFGFIVDVDIEKATNGEDADDPTGPVVQVGSTVTWTYVVTNPGDVPLRDIVVTDDQGVTPVFQGGDTNADDVLDLDETWTYEATGTAVLGQYANIGTVNAVGSFEADGIPVDDSDPSHYLAVNSAIQIEKTPDTAEVPRGVGHTFTIEVTNIGTEDLTDVVVTDPVTPSCDMVIGDLAAGAVFTYDCDVDAVFEVIDNVAFVEGTDQYGTVVTDDDDARVIPVEVGGTSLIGDTVWRDDNGNGIQDADEPGIAGARVRIQTIANRPLSGSSPQAVPLAIDVTLVTDATGHYLEPALVAGTYEVTLDLGSVNGSLTTPQVFTVPLDVGEEYLDADFGVVVDDLPFTGMDFFRLTVIAISLLLAGFGIVVSARYRAKGA